MFEIQVVEGFDSWFQELGFDCWFHFHQRPRRRFLRREVESLRPPGSGEVICCLAWILGESRDSGVRLGLDARADDGISSGASRTVSGKSRDPLPFSRSGLIMGDFVGLWDSQIIRGGINLFRVFPPYQ